MIKRSALCGIILFLFLASVTDLSAQNKPKVKSGDGDFCSQNWSNGDKYSARDLRELTLAAGDLTVDGKRNGGITVRGEDRSDILVQACVQAWADSEAEAQSVAKNIRVETAGTIRAEGVTDQKRWGVSYRILVPRNNDLKLTTMNGGISIAEVNGKIEFEATNGGIVLSKLAGDVRGKTTNGGVNVKFGGTSWNGAGLSVETTNGGVSLVMNEAYAARIETGTVNGGFSSEIPGLKIERTDDDRWGRTKKRVTADLNGGGAPIRVVTTNGGVKIEADR